MNEVLKAIKERRITRKFKPEQIKEEELQSIIDAGLYAPSGTNQQPWHFTVIQNNDLIDEINFEAKEVFKQSDNEFLRKIGFNEKYKVTYDAPTIILISYRGRLCSRYTKYVIRSTFFRNSIMLVQCTFSGIYRRKEGRVYFLVYYSCIIRNT